MAMGSGLPGLGNAAMDLGLTGMGDQAALQTKQQELARKKKGALNPDDPLGMNSNAVQQLFGGAKVPPLNGF